MAGCELGGEGGADGLFHRASDLHRGLEQQPGSEEGER